jgi:hypothetical protein
MVVVKAVELLSKVGFKAFLGADRWGSYLLHILTGSDSFPSLLVADSTHMRYDVSTPQCSW